jgi:coatomer subunit beta
MRHSEISSDHQRTNALKAEAMLIMISIIRVGQSQFVQNPIDEDTVDRIMSCVRSLSEFESRKELETTFLEDTKSAFRNMVLVEDQKREELGEAPIPTMNSKHLLTSGRLSPAEEIRCAG